jgi:DNA-binding CsgD family transcriptional regulator
VLSGFIDALPAATDAVGTAEFEKRLADTIGRVLDYDFITMARYSAHENPRFLIHSHTFPSHMAELYLSQFIDSDPYIDHWRKDECPGVVWLQDVAGLHKRFRRYTDEFLPQIGVKDEIGVFMPAIGHDSVAFFYNNRRRLFSAEDLGNARAVFAVAAALYRLHIRTLLDGDGSGVSESPSLGRPRRVTSDTGATIWITNEWGEQQAPETPMIRTVIGPEFGAADRFVWTLAPSAGPSRDPHSASYEAWVAQSGLTARERSIVGLMLKGHDSPGIAAALSLSVGNVKNHKRRIYAKLDISSERQLFVLYLDILRQGQDSRRATA